MVVAAVAPAVEGAVVADVAMGGRAVSFLVPSVIPCSHPMQGFRTKVRAQGECRRRVIRC